MLEPHLKTSNKTASRKWCAAACQAESDCATEGGGVFVCPCHKAGVLHRQANATQPPEVTTTVAPEKGPRGVKRHAASAQPEKPQGTA